MYFRIEGREERIRTADQVVSPLQGMTVLYSLLPYTLCLTFDTIHPAFFLQSAETKHDMSSLASCFVFGFVVSMTWVLNP